MKKEDLLKNFHCQFCDCNKATAINTYKHRWISCNNCRNIIRHPKDRYFFEFIPKKIFGQIKPEQLAHPKTLREFLVYALYKNPTSAVLYDYYLDGTKSLVEGAEKVKGTKWENETRFVSGELREWKVDLKDKKILEVSGGPGFFAQELAPQCRKWVVTEYNQTSVDRMKSGLGLNAIKYDFNTDNISELVDDTFDVVFIRHSIDFCLDIRKMLSSLKKVIAQDATIYVSGTMPTLASCLRWSLDDYTFLILYTPETIQKLFHEQGFEVFGQREQGSRHWIFGKYWLSNKMNWAHVLASPMTIPYYVINRFKSINTSARETNFAMIYKRTA